MLFLRFSFFIFLLSSFRLFPGILQSFLLFSKPMGNKSCCRKKRYLCTEKHTDNKAFCGKLSNYSKVDSYH